MNGRVARVLASCLAVATPDIVDANAGVCWRQGEADLRTMLRVLRGDDPATIPVTTPRKISLVLNLRSAQHLGIEIPRELEAEASEVVR